MQVIDYVPPSAPKNSEAKSILVIGETFPHKAKLGKDGFGGKFNKNFTVKGKSTPGWIFDKKDAKTVDAVKAYVKKANNSKKKSSSSSGEKEKVKQIRRKKANRPVSSESFSSSVDSPKKVSSSSESSADTGPKKIPKKPTTVVRKKVNRPASSDSSSESREKSASKVDIKKAHSSSSRSSEEPIFQLNKLVSLTDFQVLFYLHSNSLDREALAKPTNQRRVSMCRLCAERRELDRTLSMIVRSEHYDQVIEMEDNEVIEMVLDKFNTQVFKDLKDTNRPLMDLFAVALKMENKEIVEYLKKAL